MARHGEIIETETPSGEKKRFKVLELPVDPPNTVMRKLVPVETEEDEVPVGSRLLDERESDGIMARSERDEKFVVGDQVRRRVSQNASAEEREKASVKGTISAILKNGRYRIDWDNGEKERIDGKELTYAANQLTKVW